MLAAYSSSRLRVLVPIACGEVRSLRRNFSASKWVALLAPSSFPAPQWVTSYYCIKYITTPCKSRLCHIHLQAWKYMSERATNFLPKSV